MEPDEIYSILDTLEDIREHEQEEYALDMLKRLYPHVSRAFLAAVVAFDREIQQISLEKEPVAVVVHGEEWISNILEISEMACAFSLVSRIKVVVLSPAWYPSPKSSGGYTSKTGLTG